MEFNDSSMEIRTDQANLIRELDRKLTTFHCEKCNTVFGDGLSVCGEIKAMGCILLLKVTEDIAVDDKKEIGQKGDLAECIYSFLSCRCCSSYVGRVIHSAPTQLSNCRPMFLLYKPHLNCYLLNTNSMVKATSISFEQNSLSETMTEMMQKFDEVSKRITLVKKQVCNSRFKHS